MTDWAHPTGLDTGEPRPFVKELLRRRRLAEHLPGKHDQSRHGRKGAWTGPPATGSAAQYVGMKTSRAEEWIAGKSTEVALISKGGVVIWAKEGDYDSVEFDEAEFEAMKGTVHSHNHPASTGPSSHDLYLAASADLAEARIVGRDGSLMTIKPGPKGWPPKATVWTAVNTFDEQVKSEFWPKINLPEDLGPPQGWPWARSDRIEFANKAHWREVTKRTAADLGFIYAETSR